MRNFRVVSIDEAVAKEVRSTMVAPGYGHPAWSEVVRGPAPCRVCLTRIEPAVQRLIGFTYDAFRGWDELPLPGPIFVHEQECTPYQADGTIPKGLCSRYVLDAYRRGCRLVLEEVVDEEEAESALARLCGRPDIDYIHARSASAGCFQFAVVAR